MYAYGNLSNICKRQTSKIYVYDFILYLIALYSFYGKYTAIALLYL